MECSTNRYWKTKPTAYLPDRSSSHARIEKWFVLQRRVPMMHKFLLRRQELQMQAKDNSDWPPATKMK